ncbi:immune inhibitor A domain-containing protein [Streptomyces sp. NBC_00091]|uniref:immune inhibitor A domain-containing protein n=1 Tax=Streptomyces sp. NBC_00091 TaxID=2975648 RepID=UPI00225BAE3D|nr:immune inhibitor A domain-containing protein [Streptomyces sp. NBC_00091]MCX5375108.1 immune inhibitor A [Streptomyces sp. NBC_00091]
MRRLASAGAAISLAALALLPVPALAATAPPPAPQAEQAASPPLPPLELQRQALRRQALEGIAAGGPGSSAARTAGPLPRTAKIGHQYVELAQQRKDKVFVILAEFGDQADPRFGGAPGPLHNTIGKPAADDNHTLWRKDFDRAFYQRQFFSAEPGSASMRAYYNLQSSGRYDMDGTVSDWVKLPFNEARYGTDNCTEPGQCRTNWDLVRDSTAAWYDSERAKGRTPEQIKAQLAEYDVWDRYDADRDGNFDEPDGYLDHLVVVHAGKDQTWGGGAQGKDAIWAHRWFAYWNQAGSAGPEGNKAGGTPVGDTGIWAGDYLTGGENSGAGLFSHEFGHDLGLPDLYSSDGDNSVNFWSLMSSASYLGKGPNTTGQFPGDLDPWSKLQLGWLDYTEADAGRRTRATLGVSGYNTPDPQALLVHLPPSTTRTDLIDPSEGSRQWWSGTGDFMDNTLTRPLDLTGTTSAALTARLWYDTEQDFDFLTVEASTDGGTTWTALPGTVNGAPIPAKGISGTSPGWTDLTIPLTPYAGHPLHLRLHTTSDSNTHGRGVTLDDIRITAEDGTRELLHDGAEQGDNGWTPLKWSRTEGRTGTEQHPRAYFVENRRHTGYGTLLKSGPYNFGFTGDKVEFFPYQQGVLIWLWDTAYSDNTTKAHPGSGLLLPVDARPDPLRFPDGTLAGARVQTFDAPFSTRPTDRITVHKAGTPLTIPSRPGIPVFDDRHGTYWTPDLPQLGVKVPDTGTRIQIQKESPTGTQTTIQLTPSSP